MQSLIVLIFDRICVKLPPVIFMKKQIQGSIYLLLGTIIWGAAFVAQSVGMDYIGPYTFQFVRSLIALVALLPMICLADRRSPEPRTKWTSPRLWRSGIPCGVALFMACGLQQVGLIYTDAGKAGFITAMYIVLVPLFGLFFRQSVGRQVWASVALAVVGLYLLSAAGVSAINVGDVYIMGAAVAFAVQITLIDRLAQGLDGLRLNFVQFLVNCVLSGLVMLLSETPSWQSILDCALPLLYTGILSSAVAYSLQILGQQLLSPTRASLIMSMESVFAVLFGWLLLHQTMSATELLGCALVLGGVVLSQMPGKK